MNSNGYFGSFLMSKEKIRGVKLLYKIYICNSALSNNPDG